MVIYAIHATNDKLLLKQHHCFYAYNAHCTMYKCSSSNNNDDNDDDYNNNNNNDNNKSETDENFG